VYLRLGKLIVREITRQTGHIVISLLLLLSLSCGAVPGAVSSPASCPPRTTPVNDTGLTEEQKAQLIESLRAEASRYYGVWVANLNPSTIPYATLAHAGMDASYTPPDGDSLSAAKANASLVVGGTVRSISPQTTGGTNVTIAVNQTIKGQTASTVLIHQASHLEPRDNWKTVVIVDAANAPLLLPGESVFLFLKPGSRGLYQMSYTGTYYVRDGRILALAMNPFASKVNGLAPGDFSAAVTAA